VLPVVLFHAGVPFFSGGYVGVDVFFVISGYLIAGILLADLGKGRYSIRRFYERRIRRIFPALAVVVAATLAAGVVLLAPASLAEVGRSAIAVGVFASNIFFWRSVDYFADAHAVQPLLHTWSLAVEEQFYILFPPFLALMYRRRWPIVPILAVLGLVSFAAAAVFVFSKPSATFYLPFTRAWELLAGVLLAAGAAPRDVSPKVRNAAGAIGLALILLPVFLYDSDTPFPGLAALPPVLGTALVIWSGEGGATATGRLLALRPFVWIGLISYSLYLWHVPIFSYAAYLAGGVMPPNWAVASVVATFALAWLSYRFVETPFRAGEGWRVRRPALVGAAAMLLAVGAGGGLAAAQGWPSRLDARARMLVEAAADKDRVHRECLSVGEVILPPTEACRFGAAGVAPSVLLWGDSHAMVTATALEAAAEREGAAFLFAATADCPIGLGFEIDGGTEPNLTGAAAYRFCGTYNREMLNLVLSRPEITKVVLSARWTNWRIGAPANPAEDAVDVRLRDARGVARSGAENRAVFERGFLNLLRALREGGKQVFIVGPLPEPAFNVPDRLYVERFGTLAPARAIAVADYQTRHRGILSFFAQVERAGLARVIRPATVLCRGGECPIETDGRPNFFDHNHLSVAAALRTAPLYAPVFN
jgi:peptidoglycan/LPS O-acetylase OafA/YrhL